MVTPRQAVPEPDPEPVPVEIIRFTQVKLENGRVTFWAGCEGCFELQMAYSLEGPWYPAGQGSCTQPVDIAQRPEGGAQFFRAVSVPCPEPERSLGTGVEPVPAGESEVVR